MSAQLPSPARIARLSDLDLAVCRCFNSAGERRVIERLFAVVSRLGDGVFWYSLMAVILAWEGLPALMAVARMLLAGGLGLALYKWLKRRTLRPRPCTRSPAIRVTVAPLDEFSFPSGHTLHAVAFTVVAVAHYPGLLWLLLPFTVLVAVSRLVLGLHYPSDVLAGALLGGGLASLVLGLA
ncbi:phosphatase PAP2 family protein [Plasticicumulans acidivorans]|uniref:undecaprenyl-diphosphate phosphatase n=1 Tax=Plasticicumulans acidivorans TaxID=886464 RepID=A0A317MYQ6_9GAMM|nr:phosphatase PAP2 family protein [Plasticicumulans acidivorans]PWV64492.1 undecaprenyl-diphosphatase [Plasticicumulans acidivorans]